MSGQRVAVTLRIGRNGNPDLLDSLETDTGSRIFTGADAPFVTGLESALDAARRYGFPTTAERESAALVEAVESDGTWTIRFDLADYLVMLERL